MPKIVKPLTPTQVSNAKPRAKTYTLHDGQGLYAEVPPRGRIRWRLKFRLNGRERRCSLGVYPDISLAQARKARAKARELIAKGVDPVVRRRQRRAARARDTFEAVARDWHKGSDWSEAYAARVLRRLEIDVFPELGSMPVADIRRADVVRVLEAMNDRQVFETAYRAARDIEAILDFAVTHEMVQGNVAARLTTRKAQVLKRRKVRHFAAVTDKKGFGALLRAVDDYQGDPQGITRAGLLLLSLTAVRPGELRHARWDEFDFAAKIWTIPAARMKQRRPHLVPLARQTLEILRELKARTGGKGLVLPGLRDPRRPLSNNTFNACLRKLGYDKTQATAHGFRSSFSTIQNETGVNSDWIEFQLSHVEGKVRGAYNKARYLRQRTAMMQRWADLLDKLRSDS